MNEEDVIRFGLILAIQAEIEGMKVANSERDLPAESVAYTDEDFQAKADELRNVSYCDSRQL